MDDEFVLFCCHFGLPMVITTNKIFKLTFGSFASFCLMCRLFVSLLLVLSIVSRSETSSEKC